PPINLEERINWLVRYPHGCIEQTSSQAFAQLHLGELVDMTPLMKAEAEDNVRRAINSLRNFQLSNGGFSYWPGLTEASEWGSTYAGHFFLSAEKKGYNLPPNM